MDARYDGYADWYDSTFGYLTGESAGLLARLLGPPDADDPSCLDVGCGTGLHFGAVQQAGYEVTGVDVSGDQLRIARTRSRRVLQADARQLPMRNASIPAVVMTFTHTDVDDFGAAVGEAVRVLRPGGGLIYLGLHPTFVGAFTDRTDEAAQQELRFCAGYGEEGLRKDESGRFPVRSRVGARNLTLGTFLKAFLAQPRLRLSSVDELDTGMRPWRSKAEDGRIVPWNIAVTARATS